MDPVLRCRSDQRHRPLLGLPQFRAERRLKKYCAWGILVGGEELHNNHHAYATSAKLSSQWWEFDVGWLYIRILETLGLARVRRVAPSVHFDPTKQRCDAATVQAIITHRYQAKCWPRSPSA